MNVCELYSPQAESGIICSLIQNSNLYFYCENLNPRHFYNTENGFIYFAISELIKKGIEKIDTYNILMILNSKKATENAIANITNDSLNELITLSSVIARDTSEEYSLLANEILDYSFRRETLNTLEESKRMLFNPKEEDIQSKIYNKIEDIICSYREDEVVIPISEQVNEIWDRISSSQKDNDFIEWKFPTLNQFCKLSRTDCIVVSALQKRGKSIFLLNCLVNLLTKNKKVLYIDTELDTDLFFMRMLAHLCQIDFVTIRDRKFDKDEHSRISKALDFIKSKCFIHKYIPVLTEESLLSLTKQAKNKYGTEVVILDYLKGNGSYALDAFKNSAYLGRMTDLCKNVLAGKEKLFLLIAVQSASDQQEAIADSKKIIRNCSALLHLARKTPEEIQKDGGFAFGNMKLICEANRNGPLHNDGEYISLFLDGDKCTFTESKQVEIKKPY